MVGSYLATANTLIPSLVDISTPRDLALTLSNAHKKASKELLAVASTSSICLAYIAHYLRSTPALSIPLASIVLSQGSFLPHLESTHIVIGAGWEYYAAAAVALGTVIPWQIWGVGRVEKRIEEVSESIRTSEARKIGVSITTQEAVEADANRWKRGQAVSGGLAAAGALLAGYAASYW